MHEKVVCGIMSGTSQDGIDIAICRVWMDDQTQAEKIELLDFKTVAYGEELSQLLGTVVADIRSVSLADLTYLNTHLAHAFATAINQALMHSGRNIADIDLIASHGHTVYHAPEQRRIDHITAGGTLQLGCPSTLTSIAKKPVVADFRAADVALGGQGAPLVPKFDLAFLRLPDTDVCALNIGGIANCTIMPAGDKMDGVKAFDTGPGNVLIDLAARRYFGKPYDEDGRLAKAGVLCRPLLNALKQEQFIFKKPPKSTGRELFNAEYLDAMLQTSWQEARPAEDLLHTLTFFTAWSITENLRTFANPAARVVVSGGGVHNPTLVNMLSEELPEAQIVTSNLMGIDPDAKEAMCFAYLGWRTLHNRPGNVPQVTGAAAPVILGGVYGEWHKD